MFRYLRCLPVAITTFSMMFLARSAAFAQQSSGAEGQELQTPWMMGNIILVLFTIGLFALAVRSARRDFSAIPDEFGNRPNAKNQKKKGKKKLDFSKGPIRHPDLQNATTLFIVTIFIPIIVFFSLPAAIRVRDEIKGDPRFLGEGTASTLVILNYIFLGLWIVNFISGIVALFFLMASGGQAG